MSLETTEAVVLKAFNWSESSRTVVLFTRDFGKLALVDKGGRRINGRRGRLVPFARLEVTFYHSEKESNGYISDVTLVGAYSLEGEGSLGRLAFASAGCELLYQLLSERERQAGLFEYFVTFLGLIETVPKQALAPVFLTFFIRLLSFLGYHPSLGYCVGCGKGEGELVNGDGRLNFSPERGGMVCGSCKTVGEYYIPFSPESHRLLLALQSASLKQAAELPVAYDETTRLLEALTKFVAYQADIKAELKSLAFLEKLKNSNSMS
jgi:DNA repair protein RecO (recombination protein O)